jgi:hypothetical protein
MDELTFPDHGIFDGDTSGLSRPGCKCRVNTAGKTQGSAVDGDGIARHQSIELDRQASRIGRCGRGRKPLVFLGLMVTPPVFPAVALIVATVQLRVTSASASNMRSLLRPTIE